MELHLMLVNDVRTDGDVAEGTALAAAAFQIEITSHMGGPLDGQTAHRDETFVRTGDVVDGQTEVEVLGVTDETGGEVGDGLRLLGGGGLIGLIHETVLRVNHVAEGEFVPVQTLLLEGGLQSETHAELAGHFQLIRVDHAGRVKD